MEKQVRECKKCSQMSVSPLAANSHLIDHMEEDGKDQTHTHTHIYSYIVVSEVVNGNTE